jgi:hypothetical protein
MPHSRRQLLANAAIAASRVGSYGATLMGAGSHGHESRKKFVEHRGFDNMIGADRWLVDPRAGYFSALPNSFSALYTG